ncbi:MAG: phosphoribosylamine--glycine ligase [Planctomycetes bacterium]|nr:phosphoribosylamine--glycine ligase [Planctomycetota bacterium]
MKILVVGGGGREHALAWKIAQSPLVDEVFAAPGNPGIAAFAQTFPVAAEDLPGQLELARRLAVDLVVVGPEAPLCAGLVDALADADIKAFGPDRRAAEIEGDKALARDLCRRHRIPGPGYRWFDDLHQALAWIDQRTPGPLVVKAAGLAAGKGVYVAKDLDEARDAVRECLERGRFGAAGRRVVLEDKLEGPEVSVISLTDGRTIVPLESARDHKPVFDGDKGPNTGGMGAVSPAPRVPARIASQIEREIVLPSVHALNQEGRTFRGFLYAGLMLTDNGPRVLEYNCRLGDPETQPLLMRLKSDLVPLLLATVDGTLESCEPPEWDPRPAVCVMLTSDGYPGNYPKGLPIEGLDAVESGPDLQVFHSGTARRPDGIVTAGGRVLATCALGADVAQARERAYAAVRRITFRGCHFRTDIGLR